MKQRLIRVLVYEGTPERIQRSIEQRGVKGSISLPDLTIKEAIVGDFLEEVIATEVPQEETPE